jgi:hypothetical protein
LLTGEEDQDATLGQLRVNLEGKKGHVLFFSQSVTSKMRLFYAVLFFFAIAAVQKMLYLPGVKYFNEGDTFYILFGTPYTSTVSLRLKPTDL